MKNDIFIRDRVGIILLAVKILLTKYLAINLHFLSNDSFLIRGEALRPNYKHTTIIINTNKITRSYRKRFTQVNKTRFK